MRARTSPDGAMWGSSVFTYCIAALTVYTLINAGRNVGTLALWAWAWGVLGRTSRVRAPAYLRVMPRWAFVRALVLAAPALALVLVLALALALVCSCWWAGLTRAVFTVPLHGRATGVVWYGMQVSFQAKWTRCSVGLCSGGW